MLTCATFQDRLYDEDARAALEGGAAVPADMAAHRTSCAACARVWDEAVADLHAFSTALAERMPAAVEQRLRTRLAAESKAMPLDWSQGLIWAAVGGAAMFAAAAYLPPSVASLGLGPTTLAFFGASLAFSASAAREAIERSY
jgi:hypothetical protein